MDTTLKALVVTARSVIGGLAMVVDAWGSGAPPGMGITGGWEAMENNPTASSSNRANLSKGAEQPEQMVLRLPTDWHEDKQHNKDFSYSRQAH